MSKWSETGLECPCGKSSDAFCIDFKGHGYCFSGHCEDPVFYNFERVNIDLSEDFSMDYVPYRGINKQTVKFCDILTKIDSEGNPVERCFRYPFQDYKKYKKYDGDKKFRYRSDGVSANSGLYLQDKFDMGSMPAITIVEGEDDAASAVQMLGKLSAVVSLKSSSSARRDIKESWDYINSFDKIVLCLDNDEPGQNAAANIAGMFDFKKVYQYKLGKHKDANEYLVAQDVDDFINGWKGCKRYTPDNILSTFSDFRDALKDRKEELISTYPLKRLNDLLYGIHRGEVIVLKAQEGTGKTECFRFIENHILKTTSAPIGLLHLEEDNGTTIKAIAAYHAGKPVDAPDSPVNDEEIMAIFKEAVGHNEARVFLHSSFDVEDETAFIDNIRFLVSACGCEVIFLDHISWLATGSGDDDERKKLDRISQKLKLLAKELKFALVMISHVNDDGKTRGSRNITKVANTVIDLSRDKTSADKNERNKIYFLVEKARLRGSKTGPAGYAYFSDDTSTLVDPLESSKITLPEGME